MNSCRQLARAQRHAPDAPALTLTVKDIYVYPLARHFREVLAYGLP
jgi:hypothetical protein